MLSLQPNGASILTRLTSPAHTPVLDEEEAAALLDAEPMPDALLTSALRRAHRAAERFANGEVPCDVASAAAGAARRGVWAGALRSSLGAGGASPECFGRASRVRIAAFRATHASAFASLHGAPGCAGDAAHVLRAAGCAAAGACVSARGAAPHHTLRRVLPGATPLGATSSDGRLSSLLARVVTAGHAALFAAAWDPSSNGALAKVTARTGRSLTVTEAGGARPSCGLTAELLDKTGRYDGDGDGGGGGGDGGGFGFDAPPRLPSALAAAAARVVWRFAPPPPRLVTAALGRGAASDDARELFEAPRTAGQHPRPGVRRGRVPARAAAARPRAHPAHAVAGGAGCGA